MAPINVLVIGFDALFRDQLKVHMQADQFAVQIAETENEVMERLGRKVDVALLDMSGPEEKALQYIDTVKRLQPLVQVICAVPAGHVKLSIKGMKHGAYDDIQFPFPWEVLIEKVKSANAHRKKLKKRKKSLWKRIEDHIIAGSLAQDGSREMALQWLKRGENDGEENNGNDGRTKP